MMWVTEVLAGRVRKATALRRLGVLLAAVLLAACQSAVGKGEIMTEQLATERLAELEQVRQAAIGFLKRTRPEQWRTHVEELSRGKAMLLDQVFHIGRWTFDFGTGVLLRDADIAEEVRRYGMTLRHDKESGWLVEDDFWEREQWEFDD